MHDVYMKYTGGTCSDINDGGPPQPVYQLRLRRRRV